ncbi:MAG: hypothetical protein KKD17_06815 [Nanoarchaeota archaeon]|nr:hypothetical protein [Nanoarchaeota archaeon]
MPERYRIGVYKGEDLDSRIADYSQKLGERTGSCMSVMNNDKGEVTYQASWREDGELYAIVAVAMRPTNSIQGTSVKKLRGVIVGVTGSVDDRVRDILFGFTDALQISTDTLRGSEWLKAGEMINNIKAKELKPQ